MAQSSFLCHCFAALPQVLLIVISILCLDIADAQTGVAYGTLGNNLPSPQQVVFLCNRYNIRRLRLFNPNPALLQALRTSPNIAVTIGLPNEEIKGIAQNPNVARAWVQNNVCAYPGVNFRYIAVGNELSRGSGFAAIAPCVAPAMQNIKNALYAVGLGGRVKVSTALSTTVLGKSYPPSAGEFRPEIRDSFIDPVVKFLVTNQYPLLVNVYPYFAYIGDPQHISLDYALFTHSGAVVRDGPYEYQNLFDAIVDATYAALEKAGGANVEIVVSESGWPSAGGAGATTENARIYNTNLIRHVNQGTPRRRGRPIEAYIFDLIDENLKSPETEKHFGVFLPNQQVKYPIRFG